VDRGNKTEGQKKEVERDEVVSRRGWRNGGKVREEGTEGNVKRGKMGILGGRYEGIRRRVKGVEKNRGE
jgi:hypothetical protein